MLGHLSVHQKEMGGNAIKQMKVGITAINRQDWDCQIG